MVLQEIIAISSCLRKMTAINLINLAGQCNDLQKVRGQSSCVPCSYAWKGHMEVTFIYLPRQTVKDLVVERGF